MWRHLPPNSQLCKKKVTPSFLGHRQSSFAGTCSQMHSYPYGPGERPRGVPRPRGWYSRINPIVFASPPALLRARWGEQSGLGLGEPSSYKQTRGKHKASTPWVTTSAGTRNDLRHAQPITESPSLPQGRYLHRLNHGGSNLNTEVGGRLARLPERLTSEELGGNVFPLRKCQEKLGWVKNVCGEKLLGWKYTQSYIHLLLINPYPHQQCPTDLFYKLAIYNWLFSFTEGVVNQPYFHWKKIICVSLDKNNLQCPRLSTTCTVKA